MTKTILPRLATIMRNVAKAGAEDLAAKRAQAVVPLRPFLLERARLAGGDGKALVRRLEEVNVGLGCAPNTPAWRQLFGNG